MGKKLSERVRKPYRLDSKDFNGQDIKLLHIDDVNIKLIQEIMDNFKDDSTGYMFELIKLLVIGEDYEIDLDLYKDRELIEDVITNKPDEDTRKIMIEILKMILENGNTIYEMTEPINKLNPNLKNKLNESINNHKKESKKLEDMSREELLEYMKLNSK